VGKVLPKCLTMRALIVFDDFGHRYPEFAKQMVDRVRDGKFRYRKETTDGLERFLAIFFGLFTSKAFGKRVVKLSG